MLQINETGFIIQTAIDKGWTAERISTATYEALFEIAGLIAGHIKLPGEAVGLYELTAEDRTNHVLP